MQKGITDGTFEGDPPGSNNCTILRQLLGTSEHIKEGIKGGVLDESLDGMLLGAEPGTGDGYILGSNDGLSLRPR